MTYQTEQRERATAWKQTLSPNGARASGHYRLGTKTYPFCLPRAHAALTLLPEVRPVVSKLFADLNISWHDSVDGGPSNHLLDSQVQCANALGQMVTHPDRLKRAFGKKLDIDEVLEIEPGRFLTFEYIGPVDFFNEARGRTRIRGAQCTSVDAAFLYRKKDGTTELALLEWKYTENCQRKRPAQPKRDKVRRSRYRRAFLAADGPVRSDILDFEFVLDEPFYQLVRQQLLAHALERCQLQATKVRVVHVSPAGNLAYQNSLVRQVHKDAGDTVSKVWQKMLREPDRFVPMDSKVFLDPLITSADYVARYGPTSGS